MPEILDLDILRPEKDLVKLGGNIIDVSFVPVAITFEVDEIVREINNMSADIAGEKPEALKRALDLSIKLCAYFASWKYPEMNEEWFRENISGIVLKELTQKIKRALDVSYRGLEDYGKNQ